MDLVVSRRRFLQLRQCADNGARVRSRCHSRSECTRSSSSRTDSVRCSQWVPRRVPRRVGRRSSSFPLLSRATCLLGCSLRPASRRCLCSGSRRRCSPRALLRWESECLACSCSGARRSSSRRCSAPRWQAPHRVSSSSCSQWLLSRRVSSSRCNFCRCTSRAARTPLASGTRVSARSARPPIRTSRRLAHRASWSDSLEWTSSLYTTRLSFICCALLNLSYWRSNDSLLYILYYSYGSSSLHYERIDILVRCPVLLSMRNHAQLSSLLSVFAQNTAPRCCKLHLACWLAVQYTFFYELVREISFSLARHINSFVLLVKFCTNLKGSFSVTFFGFLYTYLYTVYSSVLLFLFHLLLFLL